MPAITNPELYELISEKSSPRCPRDEFNRISHTDCLLLPVTSHLVGHVDQPLESPLEVCLRNDHTGLAWGGKVSAKKRSRLFSKLSTVEECPAGT